MPTPRSPDVDKRSDERKKAEQLYLDSKGSMKLVEIAEKLGLPDNKIRKWKSLDGWEAKLHPGTTDNGKKKQVERSTNSKGSVPRKRGAQKGNKNSVGNRGNPNAVPPDATKHGGYSAVYWDVLDDEEKGLIKDMPKDEEMLLLEQIQLFSVRERRIMQAINKYRNSESPVAVAFTNRSEHKRAFENAEEETEYNRIVREKIDKGERMPGKEYSTFTQTDNKDQIIARLESELSNVQSKKTKAIEALAKLHIEKQKLEGDSSANDMVKSWAEKVLKARRDSNAE
jgi:uncharacterized protein YjcR